MKTHLKIKIMSLAAEACIIKAQQRRWKAAPRQAGAAPHAMWWSLREHRLDVVRPEARHSLLAYGFLRGRPYRAMEAKCYQEPDWDKVHDMALRFGGGDKRDVAQRFAAWKES
jgi:hypothetical protein